MLLFGSHGAIPPTSEWRVPDAAGKMEKQKAPAAPESAAQALDGVVLD